MKEIINENYESINNDKDDCDCKREEKCKDECIRKESIFFSGSHRRRTCLQYGYGKFIKGQNI